MGHECLVSVVSKSLRITSQSWVRPKPKFQTTVVATLANEKDAVMASGTVCELLASVLNSTRFYTEASM